MSWKESAIELAQQGMSRRKIAEKVNTPRTTVSDYLRKTFKQEQEKSCPETDFGLKIAIIADTQCKPNESMEYMKAVGRFLADKEPDVIVHIGDHFDFPSLSSYDKGKKSFEGRRLMNDLRSGQEGMNLLFAPINEKQTETGYSPRLVFCVGNHEDRFDRLSRDNPELEGFVGVDTLGLESYGWEVHPYLKPVNIEGIHFVHYLANPFTGKPYGGTALSQLKSVGTSFVVGHKQLLDVAMLPTLDGKMRIGIINGACYPFEESYKGFQGNNHFRGVTMLNEVKDGFGLPSFASLAYIMQKYC